jgi:hypothetical protein
MHDCSMRSTPIGGLPFSFCDHGLQLRVADWSA